MDDDNGLYDLCVWHNKKKLTEIKELHKNKANEQPPNLLVGLYTSLSHTGTICNGLLSLRKNVTKYVHIDILFQSTNSCFQ